MKRSIIVFILMIAFNSANAIHLNAHIDTTIAKTVAEKDTISDRTAIKNCIELFFSGLEQRDTVKVLKTIYTDLTLKTILDNTIERKEKIITEDRTSLLNMLKVKRKGTWREKLIEWDFFIDDRYASVWITYEFYLNNQPSHKGINNIQLVRTSDGWKIFSIIDTRHH